MCQGTRKNRFCYYDPENRSLFCSGSQETGEPEDVATNKQTREEEVRKRVGGGAEERRGSGLCAALKNAARWVTAHGYVGGLNTAVPDTGKLRIISMTKQEPINTAE